MRYYNQPPDSPKVFEDPSHGSRMRFGGEERKKGCMGSGLVGVRHWFQHLTCWKEFGGPRFPNFEVAMKQTTNGFAEIAECPPYYASKGDNNKITTRLRFCGDMCE